VAVTNMSTPSQGNKNLSLPPPVTASPLDGSPDKPDGSVPALSNPVPPVIGAPPVIHPSLPPQANVSTGPFPNSAPNTAFLIWRWVAAGIGVVALVIFALYVLGAILWGGSIQMVFVWFVALTIGSVQLAALALAVLLYVAYQKQRREHIQQWMRSGARTRGVVTDKWYSHYRYSGIFGPRLRVKYDYIVNKMRYKAVMWEVSRKDYLAASVGGLVTVAYDPQDPAQSVICEFAATSTIRDTQAGSYQA